MIIHKQGTVTVTGGAILIEGWNVEREPEDPKDATTEQLLLAYSTDWALRRLRLELNRAVLATFAQKVAHPNESKKDEKLN